MPTALIIEPNTKLENPYSYAAGAYEIIRCSTVQKGLYTLSQNQPDIVFLSASFRPTQTLSVLEALKIKSHQALIPLVLVIDLSYKLSTIPGTTWGNKLGILSTISSAKEYNSTIHRVSYL